MFAARIELSVPGSVCFQTLRTDKAMATKSFFEMPAMEVTFHSESYKFRRLNRYWPPNWSHAFDIPVAEVTRTLQTQASIDIYIMEQGKAKNKH
jgi:hypothetical protein